MSAQSTLPLVLVALCLLCAAAAVRVETRYGSIDGVVSATLQPLGFAQSYRGIPFAAPPTGALRWARPQPPASWTAVREAKEWPPYCPQSVLPGGSEDCLYLNVAVPGAAPPVGKKLPVLVWFFGGAFVLGDSHEFGWYDGQHLATRNDVIVVTVNYRLQAFGFLADGVAQAEQGRCGHWRCCCCWWWWWWWWWCCCCCCAAVAAAAAGWLCCCWCCCCRSC